MEQTPRDLSIGNTYPSIYICSIEERNLTVRKFQLDCIENFHLLKINPPLSVVIRHVLSIENVRLPPNFLWPFPSSSPSFSMSNFNRRDGGRKKKERKDTVRVFDNPGREAVIHCGGGKVDASRRRFSREKFGRKRERQEK